MIHCPYCGDDELPLSIDLPDWGAFVVAEPERSYIELRHFGGNETVQIDSKYCPECGRNLKDTK